MKEESYTIKMHNDQGPYMLPVKGIRVGAFGIRKQGDDWVVDHAPTGNRVSQLMRPTRKATQAACKAALEILDWECGESELLVRTEKFGGARALIAALKAC